MKKLFTLILATSIASSTLANTNYQSNIVTKTRDPIMGLWALDIAKTNCTEYYNFKNDTTFAIQSHQALVEGKFKYNYPKYHNESIPELYLYITKNNQQKDCMGATDSYNASLIPFSIQWISNNEFELCTEPAGKKCFARLRKVLP